jgi:4-hydroxyphenylpyruvate dioxygenase
MLYRQGDERVKRSRASVRRSSRSGAPSIGAVAFRVRDAAFAHRRALELGAWDMPTRAAAMELNIPGIHGVGDSLIYFVERRDDLSIYDVDFVPIPSADREPPALAGLHWFGLVQAVQADRSADWVDFYRTLFGFETLRRGEYFGVLPKGTLLKSPDGGFYFQLVEPPPNADFVEWNETLLRAGLGAPMCWRRCARWRDAASCCRSRARAAIAEGCLTQIYLGGFCIELRGQRRAMKLSDFGMDNAIIAGPIELLCAVRCRFQISAARDLAVIPKVKRPRSTPCAIAVCALRLQVLRD